MKNSDFHSDVYTFMGSVVTQLRKQNKMTQKALAKKLGVCHATVSAWETGTNPIDVVTLHQLCSIFNVEPVVFFNCKKLLKPTACGNRYKILSAMEWLQYGGEEVCVYIETPYKRSEYDWFSARNRVFQDESEICKLLGSTAVVFANDSAWDEWNVCSEHDERPEFRCVTFGFDSRRSEENYILRGFIGGDIYRATVATFYNDFRSKSSLGEGT